MLCEESWNELLAFLPDCLRRVILAVAETEPRAYAYLGDCIANIPFTDAPKVADTILDTIIDMHRREVLVQSFVRWMDATNNAVPDAFQDRVAQYVGPICWTFMQQAPIKNKLTDDEITTAYAALDAVTLADIPGVDAIPPAEAKDLLGTERILAKMRLEYCRQIPGNNPSAAWRYVHTTVDPIFKPIPYRGRLVDFVTEHQNKQRHSYQLAMQDGLRTWIQAQGIGIWDAYSYSLPPKLVPLQGMTDPKEQAAAAWELYWHWGGAIRFGFQTQAFLKKSDNKREGAIMEWHLLSYLASLGNPWDAIYVSCYRASEFDSIPGYEQRVLDYASRGDGSDYPMSDTRLHEANAALRIGDLDTAVKAMAEYEKMKPDGQWITILDEQRIHGTEEAATALVRAIAESPKATPDTLSMLSRICPERMGAAPDKQ